MLLTRSPILELTQKTLWFQAFELASTAAASRARILSSITACAEKVSKKRRAGRYERSISGIATNGAFGRYERGSDGVVCLRQVAQ